MSNILRLYLTVWIVVVIASFAAAGNQVIQSRADTTYVLQLGQESPDGLNQDAFAYCTFFDDTAGTSTFRDVYSQSGKFTTIPISRFRDWSRSAKEIKATWVKLRLRSSKAQKFYLAITRPDIEYYVNPSGEKWISGRVGTHVDSDQALLRLIAVPLIPVDISGDQEIEILARLTPYRFVYIAHHQLDRFQFHLLNEKSLYNLHLKALQRWLPVLAIIFTVFIYHLVLYLYNKEVSFLYLGLFALSTLILLLYQSDLLSNWLTPKNPGPQYDLGFPISYGITVFVFPFIIHYLDLHSPANLWRKLLQVSIILNFTIVPIAVFLWIYSPDVMADTEPILGQLFFMILLYNIPLMIIVGVVAWWMKNPNAFYYNIGMGTWQGLNLVGLFKAMGLVTLNWVPSWHAAPIGLLLFSFGLAQRFKQLQEQRSEAEKREAIAERDRIIEKQKAERLQELNEVTARLYTNITHEFRTPLTVILGMTQQIKGHVNEKQLIQRNTHNLLEMVNQLLDLNQLEAGTLKPVLKQIDVVPLLNYLAETLQQLCLDRRQTFTLEVLDETIWMDTDPNFLARIINNLVHNAIKFTPIAGQIKLKAYHNRNFLHLAVIDSGKGIASEHLPHIFDRFYQADNDGARSGEGSGIGLALVKELLEMLNGHVEVESTIGKGTTFRVVLTITQNEVAQGWIPSQDLSIAKGFDPITDISLVSKTEILIIEDHWDVRHYLNRLLQSKYRIREAVDGKQGLSLALLHIPDLIISDIMMPELDGYMLCKTLKQDPKTSHIPIILLTAKSTQSERLTGLGEGADAYLIKPFDEQELFIRIEKLLEIREQLRLHYQKFSALPSEKIVENRFLVKVQQLMAQNFSNDDYQSEDLANALHLSRTQLFRKLKGLTGKSFSELNRGLKISRAKELLSKTDHSISEIAYQLGFRDPSYFSKVFKEELGYTPGEFRKV
ncbi:MAG: response regulator [Saprospiraceae bacterium]|nr:response regulator [Saprospiraceae bacterium]